MPHSRDKAFDVREDGLILENGVWVSSGVATPTFSANKGDLYFQTDGSRWVNDSTPSPGTVWVNDTISVAGSIKVFPFVTTGNTNNKWLGSYIPSTLSNEKPLVVTYKSILSGIFFMNGDDDVDIDIEVYKNGVLAHIEEIRNKRFSWNAGDLDPGTEYLQGDRVSVFLRKFTGGTGDQTAQDPIVSINLRAIEETNSSGGQQFGVT